MDKVASKDGTHIAFWRTGSGPPLLLIHGGMADHTRWTLVQPALEERFTVHTIDRRGRGESEDAAGYALEREYEDVVAVLEFIGEPARVIGHSYGATCALGAALLTDRIERLVLYEPGILEGATGIYQSDRMVSALRLIEQQLGDGETEAALLTIFREVLEVPEEDVETLKQAPEWPGRVGAAHTVLRELRTESEWIFDPDRYQDLRVPTLLLTGSESVQITREGTAALDAALPNSWIVVMEGQGHVAITTAPDLFVREVLDFLNP